jgi:two-component system, OmpR family, alkaline phosphatase synthesis response regulator PhoP
MNDRVCLVEDDPTIAHFVAERLQRSGYQVAHFPTAEAAYEHLKDPFDLYILDWMLPGEMSGLRLCEHVRAMSPLAPVLILSALSDPTHRVEGLKVGADDYLSKPFEMEELLLRVHGMLRRRSWYRALPSKGSVFQWAGNSVDFQKMEGRSRGNIFSLTQKECMLLKLLVENEGEAVSRDTILDKVWGYHLYPSTRTVDNFIVRLRKYFEKEPGSPQHFISVRGLGYRFTR